MRAEVAVQLLELVAHAAEVARQAVGQGDDLARAFQRGGLGQDVQHALFDGGDVALDALLLGAQALDAAGLGAGAKVGLVRRA